MSERDPILLKLRFDGPAVGAARIPVSHLMRFLDKMNKAFRRTGRVLDGNAASVRPGPPRKAIKEELDMDLVLLTEGSPAAVLGFERSHPAPALPAMDFGLEILEKSIEGLARVQVYELDSDEALPAGYDRGVLMAWRDAGVLFRLGVERIRLTLNHREAPITTDFTPTGYQRIQSLIQGPETNIRTIEGRLLMADFKEHGTRCRVHPAVGDPVLCLFDEERKDEVLENILQYVRVVGEAREDPTSGKISSIRIYDIERLDDGEDEAADLLPLGTPISPGFWESPTLEELADAQSVKPMADVRVLFGTWPGDVDDRFEEEVRELRQSGSSRGRS